MLSVILAFFVLILATYFLWNSRKRQQRDGEPNIVPYSIPYLGRAINFYKDPVKFLKECEEKYGSVFTLFMGGQYFTFVTDPFVQHIIVKEKKVLRFRNCLPPVLKHAFDYYPTAVDDEMMKLTHHYFQGKPLGLLVKQMNRNIQKWILDGNQGDAGDKWETVGLLSLVQRVMGSASFVSLFGENPKASDTLDVQRQLLNFLTVFPSLLRGLPLSLITRSREYRQDLWKSLTKSKVTKRKEIFPIIDEIVTLHEQNGENKLLPKRLLPVLVASQVNTNPSSFWILYYLLKNSEALAAVKDEMEKVLQERSKNPGNNFVCFTKEEMETMTTLDTESAINESLRLSISGGMLRKAATEYRLEIPDYGQTYTIRENDMVLVWTQVNQMDPEIFEEPEVFKYDRFLNEDGSLKTNFYKDGKLVKYAFQPFGDGSSKCPGRYWAVLELKQLVVNMLLYYDIKLIDSQEIKMDKGRVGLGALNPTKDALMSIRRK
uniref:Cytochrome P450 n=1 Tax=Ciona intestinalis TaxID=7719 RepID=F6UPT3_CIOIN